MFACPHCSTDLPSEAKKCPCCGRTFLSAYGKPQGALSDKIRARLEALRSASDADAPPPLRHPLDWRQFGLASALFLFLFAVAGFTTKHGAAGAGRSKWVDPSGRGRPAAAADIARLAAIRLEDLQLLPDSGSVEARGRFTNGSGDEILEANIQTFFQLRDGRLAGPVSGVVRLVKPGETVEFSTSGSTTEDPMQLATGFWHSELGQVRWTPRAKP